MEARPIRSLFRSADGVQFDCDQALRELRTADPRLGRLIAEVGPFRLKVAAMRAPMDALVEAIVHQQLTGKVAKIIFDRVRALFPRERFSAEQILDTPDSALRAAGLSRAKIAALKDLASKTLDGTVPTHAELRRMDDEAIVSRLTAVRGIGPWTVEMLLIFRLGRPDVLPVHDYGIRKGFALAFGTKEVPTPAQVELRGARWKPFRTVASWYLWRALELPAGALDSAALRSGQAGSAALRSGGAAPAARRLSRATTRS